MKHAKSRIKTRGYYRRSERLSGFVGLGGSIVLCLWLMVLGQGINLSKQKAEAKEYNKPVVVVPKDSQMTEKQQIMSYIVEVFGDDADKLITMISTCENSEFNQEATNWNSNGTIDKGVAQINSIHISGKEFPVCKEAHNSWKANIDCAKAIKDKYGFKAWSCSTKIGVKSFWQ